MKIEIYLTEAQIEVLRKKFEELTDPKTEVTLLQTTKFLQEKAIFMFNHGVIYYMSTIKKVKIYNNAIRVEK